MFDSGNDYPLVSVLVLSYRNFDGIKPTLLSILDQDYPNIEIIVSDDGSDGFSEIAPSIRHFIDDNNKGNVTNADVYTLPQNVGTVRNANEAIRRSRGAYIKTISPDDCFSSSDALSRYVDFIRQSGKLVVFAKLRGVNDSGDYVYELASCDNDYVSLRKMTPQEILNKLYARNFLPGAAEFFDRRVFEQYGLIPEIVRLIEDYVCWLHLSSKGVPFGFMDDVLIDYRLSGVSSSGHYGVAFMQDMFAIYDQYIFPNDRRFGLLQPLYNSIKRAGLNFYMDQATWDKKTSMEKVASRIKYCPFWCFTSLQSWSYRIKNRQ